MEKEELVRQLKEGFRHLTEEEELVLKLTYFEEFSEDDVCYCMDIEPYRFGLLYASAKSKMRHFTTIFDDIDKASAIRSKAKKTGASSKEDEAKNKIQNKIQNKRKNYEDNDSGCTRINTD
ncbi:MAG: hypothetical protein K6A38_07405 [Lachnospiraceae bacterium]|nr:hypothetical protein [Lachnospiraceae bacterium]